MPTIRKWIVHRHILPFCAALSLYANYWLTNSILSTKNDTIHKWEDLGQPKSLWIQDLLPVVENRGGEDDNDDESELNLHSALYDPCDVLPGQGEEGNSGFQALYQVNIPEVSYDTVKLLCVLYNATSSDSIIAAYEVYGSKCDNFLATTTSTIHVENIETRNILSSNATEWENLLQIFEHVDDFDVLHVATERTLVIVENLRPLLPNRRRVDERGVYIGGPVLFNDNPKRRYCNAGAGYSLNRVAVGLVLECQANMGITNAHERLADCLYRNDIRCKNTMDGQSRRYLEHGADFTAQWRRRNPEENPVPFKELKRYHKIGIDPLIWGVSSSLVGIHMVNGTMPINTTTSSANLLRRFNAIVRKTCERKWSLRLPHGALDENGNPGYIHDPTYLRENPLEPEINNDTCKYEIGTSVEGPEGAKGLQKIKISNVSASTRIMCAVYTHSGSHKHRIEAIAETYGQRCDGFMAASNLTDRRMGAVNLIHEGPEIYGNMWLKIRAMWTYMYEHYLDDFDFFHMGGDDMYVIVENLKHLVATGSITGAWNQSSPLYLGTAYADLRKPLYFCGGGAGYTLNRAALKLLVQDLFPTSACSPHFMTSQEDRKIGDCFRSAGVLCPNTQDELGEERYHHEDADFHANWAADKPTTWRADVVEERANVRPLDYLRQISTGSVSFHLKGVPNSTHFADSGIRRYHGIIYGYCK